jgi:hypothetical protein
VSGKPAGVVDGRGVSRARSGRHTIAQCQPHQSLMDRIACGVAR